MAKPEQPSVSDGFDLLAKYTELPLGEYTAITQGQADIEHSLRQHLSMFSTLLYGSFSRKTIASPLKDNVIDMLILFRETDIKHITPSRVFSKLSESLIKYHPDAYTLENRNVLMIPIKNIQYKIQPAYLTSDHMHMLPAEGFDEWWKYDIKTYKETFEKENIRHKGKLIEIIRMLKTWNRISGDLFDNHYLELLVTETLASYQMTSYSETLCHIFKTAVFQVVFQKLDPANIEFKVEGLNDINNVITAMLLLKKSYELAKEAVMFEQGGNINKALDNWNELFPQVFPTKVDMVVGKTRNTGTKGADALRMMLHHK